MSGKYLIYLRKSRQDRELELQTGSHDTLERHRAALLKLAKDRNLKIEEVLEEVVSGESIAARPEMRRLLSLVETGAYDGVLVMEVPRLARGRTRDQGIVSETFQYSNTKIITPDKIYDPANDSDEDFFEFGLFMSRQEYRMINKRLGRGRMASLGEGKYIAGAAPYGYEKYKLKGQKGYSLRIVPDKAEIVRRIFGLYTAGLPGADGCCTPAGSVRIARRLNAEGVPSPGGVDWTASAVRDILRNPVYAGMLRWSYRPVVKRVRDGNVVTSCQVNHAPKLVPGMHEPLIPAEQWELAQRIRRSGAHSCVPGGKKAANPLAGVLYCSVCGRPMVQTMCGHPVKVARLMCPTPGCPTVSHRADETESALLEALRGWLASYRVECGALQAPENDGRDNAARLEAALAAIRGRQERLYGLLEQGIYTGEVFLERSRLLADKRAAAERELEAAKAAADKQEAAGRLRENFIPNIEHVLEAYDLLATAGEKNALLKTVLDRVIFEKPSFRGNGGAPALYIIPRTGLL